MQLYVKMARGLVVEQRSSNALRRMADGMNTITGSLRMLLKVLTSRLKKTKILLSFAA